MNWTKLKIFTSSQGTEPVCGFLMQLGITGFEIEDPKDFDEFLHDRARNWDYIEEDLMDRQSGPVLVNIYLTDSPESADLIAAIRSGLKGIKAYEPAENDYGSLDIDISASDDTEWMNIWKQYYKPFTVGDRLVVKPSWEKYDEQDGRSVINIDPGMAFGSGTHETTRMCLEALETYLKPGDDVLDIGCGSGILSVAALLLGASLTVGVDTDADAVRISAENAVLNGVGEKFSGIYGNLLEDPRLIEKAGFEEFSLITANIVADVINAMAPVIKTHLKKSGKALLSGIISERAEEIKARYDSQGFKLIEERTEKDWVCLVVESA